MIVYTWYDDSVHFDMMIVYTYLSFLHQFIHIYPLWRSVKSNRHLYLFRYIKEKKGRPKKDKHCDEAGSFFGEIAN